MIELVWYLPYNRQFMRRHGFTLVELLVVIAVVALLIAITAPAMMAAKNRARSIQCSSNLRQLSLGFMVYQQEHEVFPYGFCDVQLAQATPPGGYAGNSMYDKQGLWWFNYLQSSIEVDLSPGSVLWCPGQKRIGQRDRRNLLCGNYGVNRSVCRDAQGQNQCAFSGEPLRSNQVRTPSATFLLSDSGYSLLSWLAAADTDEPVFENAKRVDSFYIPGLILNQTRRELRDNPDAIKGRHPHRTLNIGFTDGHNETCNAESLAIKQATIDKDNLPSLWMP